MVRRGEEERRERCDQGGGVLFFLNNVYTSSSSRINIITLILTSITTIILFLIITMSSNSEWKMNKVLSSIWGKLEEKRDQRKLMKYKNWCALTDKKCASSLYALKALECAGIHRNHPFFSFPSFFSSLSTSLLLAPHIYHYSPH